MLCLDIAVNGERHCVAGADDLAMFAATIGRAGGLRAVRDKTQLSVNAFSSNLATRYVWGGQPRHLKIGDVVTIRVVEASVPDIPILSETGFHCEEGKVLLDSDPSRVRYKPLFEDTAHIRDGLGGLLFWVGVAVLGIVMMYVSERLR